MSLTPAPRPSLFGKVISRIPLLKLDLAPSTRAESGSCSSFRYFLPGVLTEIVSDSIVDAYLDVLLGRARDLGDHSDLLVALDHVDERFPLVGYALERLVAPLDVPELPDDGLAVGSDGHRVAVDDGADLLPHASVRRRALPDQVLRDLLLDVLELHEVLLHLLHHLLDVREGPRSEWHHFPPPALPVVVVRHVFSRGEPPAEIYKVLLERFLRVLRGRISKVQGFCHFT